MLDCSLVGLCGLSAQATYWYREAVPPEYRRESRPKPATLDVDTADTGERLLRLVGSFPRARLVLGEVAENLCVRRLYFMWEVGSLDESFPFMQPLLVGGENSGGFIMIPPRVATDRRRTENGD